jgi:hypothetical protein
MQSGAYSSMTNSELLDRLRSAQRAEYEAELQAEQDLKASCPDAQTWDGPELWGSSREFDPSPQEQQAYADQIRAADAACDLRDFNGETPLALAVFAWRQSESRRRWQAKADQLVTAPRCAVCGADSGRQSVLINQTTLFACSRCLPAIARAISDAVESEDIGNGRSRREAARALVVQLIGQAQP